MNDDMKVLPSLKGKHLEEFIRPVSKKAASCEAEEALLLVLAAQNTDKTLVPEYKKKITEKLHECHYWNYLLTNLKKISPQQGLSGDEFSRLTSEYRGKELSAPSQAVTLSDGAEVSSSFIDPSADASFVALVAARDLRKVFFRLLADQEGCLDAVFWEECWPMSLCEKPASADERKKICNGAGEVDLKALLQYFIDYNTQHSHQLSVADKQGFVRNSVADSINHYKNNLRQAKVLQRIDRPSLTEEIEGSIAQMSATMEYARMCALLSILHPEDGLDKLLYETPKRYLISSKVPRNPNERSQ